MVALRFGLQGNRRSLVLLTVTSIVAGVVPASLSSAVSAEEAQASTTPPPYLLPADPFAPTPAQYIPPPGPATKAAAPNVSAPVQAHAAPLDPREGYSVDSHWTSDGKGHVTSQLYLAPAFRQDSSGWHPVDPTLHPSSNAAQPVSAENALRPIRFGNNAQRLLEFELDGGPVTVAAPSLHVSSPQLGSDNSVTYGGVAPATDLRYQLSAGGVKEQLVLGSASAPTTFSFVVQDPAHQLGTVHALGPNGPFIFDHPVVPRVFLEIGSAFAYEQARPEADPGSAHIAVAAVQGGWQVTESVDAGWLAGRHYPIVLDPSIYLQVTLAGTYDSPQVTDWWTRADFGPGGCGTGCSGGPGQPVLDVGSINNTWSGQVHDYYDRTVFRYDLSSVPSGSSISSSVAQFWNADCDGGGLGGPCPGTQQIILRRYASSFPFSGGTTQTVLSNTDNSLNVSTASICYPGTYNSPCLMQFDITQQMARWSSGADPNNGLVAMGPNEGSNDGGPVWYTSYYAPQSGLAKYPALQVTYSPPPSAPSNVQASSSSTSSATVTWSPASTQGGDGITGYTVNTFTASGTNVGSTPVCATCTSATVSGLSVGSSYYFTVSASNDWTTGPSAQSNTVTIVGPPLISKTSDFTGTVMLPGQSTTFHVRITSPGGTMPVSSVSDALPSGFSFGDSTLGTIRLSSSVSGVPATCTSPTCVLSGTSLTLSFSPALNLGPTDYLQIDYPAVAVDMGRGCLSEVNNAVVANQYGNTPASLAITTCESGLGLEDYWRYVTRSLGAEGKAAINVASGNLVVQQDDFTPIQAHGRLAFVLRRTYNSGDMAVSTLPGTLGSGWQFNVSETDDVVGDAVGASGLYLPTTSTVVGSPFAVTLIDRDGTRHVYQPNALSAALDIESLSGSGVVQDVSSLLSTLYPLSLQLAPPSQSYKPAYPYNHLCVDQTFTPPAGVHMWLWRYIAVDSSSSSCTPAAGTSAAIAGYGAETTDRVRYEFSADGHLLAMADEAGNELVYSYGTQTPNTQSIVATPPYPGAGPFSVPTSITEPSTSRTMSFTPTWNGTQINGFAVIDPAGRQTTYKLDGAYPSAHLIEVDNPDGSKVQYLYGDANCKLAYGASTNAAANQMCEETDPRGDTTFFTYTSSSSDGVSYPQLPRANAITDRRESTVKSPSLRQDSTQLSYYENTSPNYVTADQAAERQRFMAIDGAGRVSEIDEGTTGNQYVHVTQMTWDGDKDAQTGQTTFCRQPDGGVDNDLCHLVRLDAGFAAPDENTAYTYADEGQLLATYRCLGTKSSSPASLPPCPTTLDTTAGYSEQYFETSGTVSTFSDTDAGYNAATGHAGVTSTNRGGSTPSRIDGATLFAVVSKTQDVPARGNTAPPSGQTSQQQVNTYATTYSVDASATAAPSRPLSGGVCPSSGTNTGLLCESDGPAFDSSGAHAVTRYTYEQHGQRATMTTPKAIAQGGGSYQYFYYPDPSGSNDNTQRYDLSGHTPQGGWLKAVADPTGAFVAYAYDAAGNVVRTWDRDATQSQSMGSFPGTASGGGAPCAYTETRYSAGTAYGQCPTSVGASAYANPWRYVLFQRDQLGNATTYQVDADGNVTLTRPPRGNPTSGPVSTYDVSQAFDANDNLTCHLTPAEAAGGSCASPPSTATTYSYDAFDNRTATLDPRGHYTVTVYDAVNRAVQQWFSRGPMPSQSALVPAGCHQAGASGDPTQFGSGSSAPMICVTRTNYDDVDNVIGTADANGQATSFSYDSVHRKTQEITPRDTGVTETHEWLYDADGRVTDDCAPREFTEGSGACTSTGIYSTHNAYDASGRLSSVATYRSAAIPETTSSTYDADGNMVTQKDANGVTTTYTYDLLDRKTSLTQPRDSSTSFTTTWNYDPVGNVTAVIQPGPSPVNTSFTQLVIDGSQYPKSAPYVYTGSTSSFTSVILQNNGWMTVPAHSGSSGGTLQIVVGGQLTVCNGCGITVAGAGYPGGAGASTGAGAWGSGPGAGGGGGATIVNGVTPTAGAGGGAGHGGYGAMGTSGALSGGPGGSGGGTYGAADLSDTSSTPSNGLGSGGGGGGGQLTMNGGSGGAGGGFVRISAESMEIDGAIDASGAAGASSTTGPGGGGGSGGEIWLTAATISIASTGKVLVNGGQGGTGLNSVNGGGGGAGRIRLEVNTLTGTSPANVTKQSLVSIVTAYSYDADNRVIDTVQAADSTNAATAGTADGTHDIRTRVVYDPDGDVIARYDPRAFVSSTTQPDPLLMTRTDFDADGRPSKTYIPRYDNSDDGGAYSDLGLSSTSGIQAAQCPTGQGPSSAPTYPSGAGLCVTTTTYDATGNRLTVTAPTARSDSSSYVGYTYTDDNLVAAVEAPNPSQPGSRLAGATPAMAYVYDGDGRQVQSTDANALVTTTSYYADGLVRSVAQPPNGSITHTTSYGYDASGNRTSVTDAAGNTTTSAYSADNLLVSTSNALSDVTSYSYDGDAQAVTVASPSANAKDTNNTAGTPATYCYTEDHLVAMSLLPVSSDGSLLRQTTYTYDDAGRKIEQEVQTVPPPASGQQCVPQNRTSPGGPTFSYYNDGRLAAQTGRNGEQMSFTYDAVGDLASAWDGGSNLTISATYYADGTARTVDDHYRQTQYMADGVGSTTARVELVDNSSTRYTTTYTYNPAELPASMSSTIVPGATHWSYDPGGRQTSETDGNGQTVSSSYATDNTLTSETLTAASATTTWSYLHDADYRITQQAVSGPAGGAVQSTYCYEYDAASHLSGFRVLSPGSTCGAAPPNIGYDHDGNRLTYTDAQGNQTAYCYNADDSVTSIQPGHSAPSCSNPPSGSKAVAYAPFGGVTDDGCATYGYDGFDRLGTETAKGVSGCTVKSASYLYDGLSRQYYHNDTGVDSWLHYDGLSSQPALDSSSAGYDTVYALSPADAAIGVAEEKSGGALQYLVTDGQGNLAATTTSSQTVACAIRLDPYGSPVQGTSSTNPCNTGSTPDPFVYRGVRLDSATGDYQLGPRTYDPTKSSFLTPDTFQAGQPAADVALGTDPLTDNRYSYVNGDPVNLVDPSGHDAWWADQGPGGGGQTEASSPAENYWFGYGLYGERVSKAAYGKIVTSAFEHLETPYTVQQTEQTFCDSAGHCIGDPGSCDLNIWCSIGAFAKGLFIDAPIHAVAGGVKAGLCALQALCVAQVVPKVVHTLLHPVDTAKAFYRNGLAATREALIRGQGSEIVGEMLGGALITGAGGAELLGPRILGGAVDFATAEGAAATDAAAGDLAGASAVNPLGAVDNCVSCAIAGDSTLSGAPACAVSCGIQQVGVLEDTFGGSFQAVSGRAEIEQILQDAGPGARGVVFGSRGAGVPGHVFNAANQGGAVNFVDFQSGTGASFDGYQAFHFLLTSGGG